MALMLDYTTIITSSSNPKQIPGDMTWISLSIAMAPWRALSLRSKTTKLWLPDCGSTAVVFVGGQRYGCVWKWLVPHCTQWFCWSLSLLNGCNWEYTLFSDKPLCRGSVFSPSSILGSYSRRLLPNSNSHVRSKVLKVDPKSLTHKSTNIWWLKCCKAFA